MVSSTTRRILQGDRIRHFGGGKGTIAAIKKGLAKYEILWDNGRSESYSAKEFDKWCEVLPPEPETEDIEEEEISLFSSDFSREKDLRVGQKYAYSPGITQELEIIAIRGKKIMIQCEYGRTSTVDPEYFENLALCSPTETTAQASASDSLLQAFSSKNSNLPDSVSATNTAEISSVSDIQESQSNEISKTWTAHAKKPKSSQVRPHANHSQSKVKGSEPATNETVSRGSSKKLQQLSLDFLPSKTSPDYLTALSNPDSHQARTLKFSGERSPKSGMTLNGQLSVADTLPPPSLEKGCSWLESPGALSSTGRSPGLTRLESDLVKQQVLETGQVLNPIFLEDAFQIPLGWSDPLEFRAATALLEDAEKPSAIASTPELQQSPSNESSTSTTFKLKVCPSGKKNCTFTPATWQDLVGCQSCKNWFGTEGSTGALILKKFPELQQAINSYKSSLETLKTHTTKQTGSLYQYTANKTDKLGAIHTYPKVEGNRKREEDSHWYWGFSYVEKELGKWRDKSAAVPRKKLAAVRQALRNSKPYIYILQEILGK